MEGGLEAKIHEGGKQCIFPRGVSRFPFALRFLSAFACLCRAMSCRSRHHELHCCSAASWRDTVGCIPTSPCVRACYEWPWRYRSLGVKSPHKWAGWQVLVFHLANAWGLERLSSSASGGAVFRPTSCLAMCTTTPSHLVGSAPLHIVPSPPPLAGSRMQKQNGLRHWGSQIPRAGCPLSLSLHPLSTLFTYRSHYHPRGHGPSCRPPEPSGPSCQQATLL